MMPARATVESLWWLIHKDLTREVRACHVWPSMMLLGLVLAFLIGAQIDLPIEQKSRVGGGLLWLAIVFAGMLALERSIAGERDAGCWQSLAQYPIAPSVLFLAKMAVNLVSLFLLQLVLIPLFIVITDIPLLARPAALTLIAALGSIGFAAIGTIISAITADLCQLRGLVALLLLPLVMPVVLASAEATGIMLSGEIDSLWWRWIQLLAVFATVFTVMGALVFEFVLEE